MFTITEHEDTRRKYDRAYAVYLKGDNIALIVGNVGRLTAKKKAYIAEKLTALAAELGMLNRRPEAGEVIPFDRFCISRWENVEMVNASVTDSDSGHVRHSVSYTHSRGGGERDLTNYHEVVIA